MADLDSCEENGHKGCHHVHFSSDTDELGNTAINIKQKSAGILEAHLGFLQILHRYKITMTVPVDDAGQSQGYSIGDIQGVHCRAVKIQAVDGGKLDIEIEFFAHKEKLMRENILLIRPNGAELKLNILARVLGKHKGTPMLRENITCIGVEQDEESEASDWQGFT